MNKNNLESLKIDSFARRMYKVTFLFENPKFNQVDCEGYDGDSVLDVALDHGIELHHNCGAVCACSTCHVYVEQGMDTLPDISDKEEDFIDRAISPTLKSRLACQCKLAGDVVVTIPDQDQFNGH